jgi:hypothetical protein
MDQAVTTQSVNNTPETTPAQTNNEENVASEAPVSAAPEKVDYKDLRNSSNDSDKFQFLKKAGVFGDHEEPAETSAPEPEVEPEDQADDQQSEPQFEIKVDGTAKKVSQAELIRLAQQGDDYTRKTQALADERRELEAMKAAIKVQQQMNPESAVKAKEAKTKQVKDQVVAQYDAAVAEASRRLGLDNPDDFNQFDPAQNYVLQGVMAEQRERVKHQQAFREEVQQFFNTAKADPMSQDIDAQFIPTAYKLGASGKPEDGQKAFEIIAATQRFHAQQASEADLRLLQKHWEYTKSMLAKPNVNATSASAVEPPQTEAPGTGATTQRQRFDAKKLRTVHNSNDRFMMLKRAGVFK